MPETKSKSKTTADSSPNRWALGAIGVILIAALAGAGYYAIESARTLNRNSLSNQNSSKIQAAGQKTGDPRLYPDPQKTPGETIAGVTKEQICTPGYSSQVRDVPQAIKRQVYQEYGVSYPQPEGSYEVDHFISLELGGSNDIQNLWPEPQDPRPGFREKDKVENYLHKQVCDGHMALVEAQDQIRTDWYAVYLKIR